MQASRLASSQRSEIFRTGPWRAAALGLLALALASLAPAWPAGVVASQGPAVGDDSPCVPVWARHWPAPVVGSGAGTEPALARADYATLVSFPMTSEVFGTHFDPVVSRHQFAVGDYSGNRVVLHEVDAALQHTEAPLPVTYGQAWLLTDLDGDGHAELVLQRGDSGMGGNGYLDILSAPNWTLRAHIVLAGMKVYFYPVAINVDADDDLELYLTPSSLGGTGRIMLVDHDPASGGFLLVADLPAPSGSGGASAAGDFDADGRVEFITGHSGGYQLYECSDGQLFNRGPVGQPYPGSWACAGRPLPGGPLMPLLGHSSFANGYRYQLLRATGDNTFEVARVFQEITGYAGVHPSHALDADRDGLDELVMNFYPYARVMGWDTGLGDFATVWSWHQPTTGTLLAWSDADCDQDGTREWVSTNHLNVLQAFEDQDVQAIAESPNANDAPAARAAIELALRVHPLAGGGVTIGYELPGPVACSRAYVFDSGGRLVRRLEAGAQTAGEHRMIWDGRDARGARAGGGLFFLQVAAGPCRGSGRALVAR